MERYTYIEDFYKQTKGISQQSKKKIEAIIDRPRTYEDAIAIVNIYASVYLNTYPFKEMLDPDFIFSTFEDERYFWGLFKVKETGEIAGSFTAVYDYENRKGYFRGLMITKEYQKQIDVKFMTCECIRKSYEIGLGKIDTWYNETRTAHSSSQFISSLFSAKPFALFPNKDIFFNKRESDVLMLCHSKKSLENRENKCAIIPDVVPFFEYAKREIHTDMIRPKLDSFDLNLNPEKYQKYIEDIILIEKQDRFGYGKIEFINLETNEKLEALHTSTVENIEKVKIKSSSNEGRFALLKRLVDYAEENHIKYIEIFASTESIEEQLMLKLLNFTITGYALAWEYDPCGTFRDKVVFSKFDKFPKRNEISLIPSAQNLYDLIQLTEISEQKPNPPDLI